MNRGGGTKIQGVAPRVRKTRARYQQPASGLQPSETITAFIPVDAKRELRAEAAARGVSLAVVVREVFAAGVRARGAVGMVEG